ncbi:MAG: prolyl oligopeptidase family serine peptidase, partial [Chitinophagaceae bacterium]
MKPAFNTAGLLAFLIALSFISSCHKKDFLEGYDKRELFAAPIATEVTDVMQRWQTADLTPSGYSVQSEQQVAAGRFVLRIVSFQLQGNTEYGALVIPNEAGSFPVRMQIGGFGYGVTTNSLSLSLNTAGPSNPCILAIPALRGQSLELTLDGVVYKTPVSQGQHCDAFDGATDDALAFLNLIGGTEPRADVNRTAIRGGSRGGTVALLAGIRDARVKRVVCVAGPTDMLSLTAMHTNDATYQCQFLSDLVSNQATVAATRQKMIASSPVYFAGHLPLTQLHMGSRDTQVPIWQADELAASMTAAGVAAKLELFKYDRAHSDI